jgi:murein DD-endopeptidase MepM/ murein hydrolase activator NlpD
MINNSSLTGALSSLETKVNSLITKITGVRAQGPVTAGGAMPSGGGGIMQNSLAAFSSMAPGRAAAVMQIGGAVIQAGGQIASGTSKLMPDVDATIQRAGTFYNATLRAGAGMSRPEMQQATLQGLRGGLTAPGSDAMVAGYLAHRGMMASAKFGSTYQETIRAVGGAAKYLNMENTQAAAAIEGLTSGRGASNFIRQFGIMTADPTTGKPKTQGQIFEELAGRLTAGQPQATEEETLESLRRGQLGNTLRNSGLSEDQQAMFSQYMIERSRGNYMDLSDSEQMQSLMDKAKRENNENPFLPGYDLNTAKTDAMGGAEGQYIAGIKAATKALEGLARAGGAAASTVGFAKAFTGMLSSDPLGQGIGQIASAPFGILGGVFRSIFGGKRDGVSGDTVVSNASAASVAAGMTGGSVAGFGGGRRGAPVGGDTGTSNASAAAGAPQAFSLIHPVSRPKITAVFGQKKSSYSGEIVWPNGHKGIDYEAKLGDTIYAAADGEVMSSEGGGELGTYVRIKHDNGMYTFYAHLSSKTVSQGRVRQGQPIGAAGNTGTRSFGVHLHFALSTSSTTAGAVDPVPYLRGAASSLGMTQSSPEQSASGATPSSAGDTASGGAGEDTSKSPAAQATNILEITSSGYKVAGGAGASAAQGVEPISAASVASSKSNASMSVNGPGEGGDGYEGDGESNYISPTGASRYRNRGKAATKSGSTTNNNVTINVTIAKATDDEAKKFAAMVKRTLEDESMMKMIART